MKPLVLFLCLALPVAALGAASANVREQAAQLESRGDFRKAAESLRSMLTDTSADPALRKEIEFELDRLQRIRKDFSLTRDDLFAELKEALKGLTEAEFEEWVKEGRFDSREIDGRRFFMSASVSNLFFRHLELEARRRPPKQTAKVEAAHWRTALEIRREALAKGTPYVLPKRFEVTMTATVKPNAVPAGAAARAWLPIPRRYPFQGDFELLSASPKPINLDAEESTIRSLCLEQPAKQDKPVEFRIQYRYTTHGVWFDLKAERVQPRDSTDAALRPFIQEGPHVVFTPEMRALSREIAGDEANPCRLAKRFHDWIAEHIQYSFAIEYSTIRNISDYCRVKRYGDCGQEALLFMTLCRLNGIPARWQSGWNTFPGAKSIHDWTEIYLAPYGWVPVDPYMGIYAMRYARSLTPAQQRELRDFYFGGLDQYRMSANSDHSQPLTPPKRSMRSDTVDFQRGEFEWDSHNLYFDTYSYSLTLKEVALRSALP